MERLERTHRVEWQPIYTRDARTGRLRVSCYSPRYIPRHVTSWRDRFRDFGGFDLVMLGGFVVLVVLSVVTR